MILARIAWRNVGRHLRRSLITAAAMGVGVAMTIAVISFADGWLAQMFETIVGQQIGHVQVHAPGYPRQRLLYETIEEPDAILARLDRLSEVSGASPRAHGFALLAAGEEAAGASMIGIDPAREATVTRIAESMIEGSFLDGSTGRVLLGAGLAESLKVGLGSEIVAVTQAADGSMGNELYTVAGIYRTGSARMDRVGAFVSLADLRALFALGDSVHEIAIVTTARERIPALLSAVEEELKGEELLVRPWSHIDPSTAQILDLTDAMVWIIMFFVFSVASLGILNTMLMSVFERIRELGVLQALGLLPSKVLRLVLWETLFLASLAAGSGAALGALLSLLLEIRGLDLSRFIGDWQISGIVFDPVVYGELRLDRILLVVSVMFVIAFLASIWPAVRAARLNPVAAMRES